MNMMKLEAEKNKLDKLEDLQSSFGKSLKLADLYSNLKKVEL